LEQEILQKKHQQEKELFQHNQDQLKRSRKFDLEQAKLQSPQRMPTGAYSLLYSHFESIKTNSL